MKTAVVVPTRGDRPEFLSHCRRQIHKQTLPPDEIIFVDYRPVKKEAVDLTARYRRGIEEARRKGCSLIFFWEDDDWYDKNYLEWMVDAWTRNERPEVLGIETSYYFNLRSMKGTRFDHPHRSSMFCTALHIEEHAWGKLTWPPDHERFLDLWIWRKWQVRKATVNFVNKIYTIGIKHGIGLTGGGGHNVDAAFYHGSAYDENWLRSHIDDQSYQMYKNYEIRSRHSNL
jgi:glycosyltransferase involved in cell wall biosynthesis